LERLRALKGEVYGLLASGEPAQSALADAATAEAVHGNSGREELAAGLGQLFSSRCATPNAVEAIELK